MFDWEINSLKRIPKKKHCKCLIMAQKQHYILQAAELCIHCLGNATIAQTLHTSPTSAKGAASRAGRTWLAVRSAIRARCSSAFVCRQVNQPMWAHWLVTQPLLLPRSSFGHTTWCGHALITDKCPQCFLFIYLFFPAFFSKADVWHLLSISLLHDKMQRLPRTGRLHAGQNG